MGLRDSRRTGLAARWPCPMRQHATAPHEPEAGRAAGRGDPTTGRSEEAQMPRYGAKAKKTVESAMRRRKKGTLRSGRSGRKVTSRKQAIAIGLSEARKKGAKVPRKRSSRGGKKK